jgi:small subunit ribosomal protein S20
MPKGKGDRKRFEKQEARRVRNRSVRAAVKTYVGRARQAIAGAAGEGAQAALMRAIRELDKAAQKGVIHKNAAGRYKSRLATQVAAMK